MSKFSLAPPRPNLGCLDLSLQFQRRKRLIMNLIFSVFSVFLLLILPATPCSISRYSGERARVNTPQATEALSMQHVGGNERYCKMNYLMVKPDQQQESAKAGKMLGKVRQQQVLFHVLQRHNKIEAAFQWHVRCRGNVKTLTSKTRIETRIRKKPKEVRVRSTTAMRSAPSSVHLQQCPGSRSTISKTNKAATVNASIRIADEAAIEKAWSSPKESTAPKKQPETPSTVDTAIADDQFFTAFRCQKGHPNLSGSL